MHSYCFYPCCRTFIVVVFGPLKFFAQVRMKGGIVVKYRNYWRIKYGVFCVSEILYHKYLSLVSFDQHKLPLPALTLQLLLFCLAFCRVSFIQGNICLVMTGVAGPEAPDGDFFLLDVELLEPGEAADSGGGCGSPTLLAWLLLLLWLLPCRMQSPFNSLSLRVGGRAVEVWMGHTGPW